MKIVYRKLLMYVKDIFYSIKKHLHVKNKWSFSLKYIHAIYQKESRKKE